MPFYMMHAGTALQKVSISGALTTIVLPAGVTITDTRRMRFAALSGAIVAVNAVSRNIAINPFTLATRLLTIGGPTPAPGVAAAGGGVMQGAHRFKYTFAILDGDQTLTESAFSTVSDPIDLDNQSVTLTGIDVSPDPGVNARIIYGTTAGGADYFEVGRILDNVTTTITINVSDFDLALLAAAENKGAPPGSTADDRFRIITAWKDRLFASPELKKDRVHFSGNREIYSWGADDFFSVQPERDDDYGVVGFAARRNELVMGKRRRLWKLVGDRPQDFEQIQIAEDIGFVSQEATIVVKDTVYFLGEDGFFEYGANGVRTLTREQVHPWFTTDTYFNRALFPEAFAKYNQRDDVIELHLAAAGSPVIDRWVGYHLKEKVWFGPHRTDAFAPTAAGAMDDESGYATPVMGSEDGFLYRQNQPIKSDAGTAIDFDAITKWHSNNSPDIEKLFLELALLNGIEEGGTLTIVVRTGALDAPAQDPIYVALTSGRHRLRRLGHGRLLQLQFRNNDDNQGVTLYGYEVPFHELGRR